MEPILAIRAVTKTFGEGPGSVAAIRGVDLDVHCGEVVLLMGPSGSGKTTLLSIMGCMLRPTSGSVMVAGRDVTRLTERELPRVRLDHIGFVFQGFNLFPTLTARQNLELMLDLKNVPVGERRREAELLLDRVGLSAKYEALPANLSGGQKQRVAIARALVGRSTVLLADEPTAALDTQTGRQVLELLRSAARDQERAVVIVSHDTRTVEFADRTIGMEDGRIVDGEKGISSRAGTSKAPAPPGEALAAQEAP
jgi:putative ABC transport system ATP-binding protein